MRTVGDAAVTKVGDPQHRGGRRARCDGAAVEGARDENFTVGVRFPEENQGREPVGPSAVWHMPDIDCVWRPKPPFGETHRA